MLRDLIEVSSNLLVKQTERAAKGLGGVEPAILWLSCDSQALSTGFRPIVSLSYSPGFAPSVVPGYELSGRLAAVREVAGDAPRYLLRGSLRTKSGTLGPPVWLAPPLRGWLFFLADF